MKKYLAVLFALAGLAFGQTSAPAAAAPPKPVTLAKPGDVIKVFNIKSAISTNTNSTSSVNTLRGMYPTGSGVEMVFDAGSRTLVVRGPASAVKLIEDTLKTIDVPPSPAPVANIEVTIQLLYGSSKDGALNGVPSDLTSTVEQLRGVFPFSSFRVLDTLLLRGRDDQDMSDSGSVAGTTNIYTLNYHPNVGPKGTPRIIRLKNLRFNVRIPSVGASGNFANVGLNTDIDAREGQKTVVGKLNITGTEDAIFVVISPKVVE